MTSTTPAPAPAPTLPVKPGQQGIDPRSPRFGAGITALLLLIVIALTLLAPVGNSVAARTTAPGFVLFLAITLLFAWGAFRGVQHHPYGRLFQAVIRPRLAAPTDLEDPLPPTFAQGVGFAITLLGVILSVAGVPAALVVAASLAFVAAFLNSVFGYCLGCQIYLLLVRAGLLGRARPTAV